jgi:hypothetical protein
MPAAWSHLATGLRVIAASARTGTVAGYRMGMAEAGGENDTRSFQRLNVALRVIPADLPTCSTGSERATSM